MRHDDTELALPGSQPGSDAELVTAAEALPEKPAGNKARESWPISTGALRANLSHNSDEAADAMVSAFLFCIKENITRQDFAEQVEELGKKLIGPKFTLGDNWVYQIIRGSYRAPKKGDELGPRLPISPDKLKAIQTWVNERRAHLAESLQEKDFVITPTAKRIFMAVHYARESHTPVFLIGPSHIGKTWALQYTSRTEDHGMTPYGRIKAASGLHGLIDVICAAAGQSTKVSTNKKLNGIYGAFRGNMVLILDELQLLLLTYRRESFFACMEFIREFYDRTGIGIVLSMNDVGWENIQKYRLVELEQVFRRGVHVVRLPAAPTTEDLGLILEHNGLSMPNPDLRVNVKGKIEEPYGVLRQLALERGLKSINERLRYGKKLAAKDGRRLSWAHVMTAHLTINSNAVAPATGWDSTA